MTQLMREAVRYLEAVHSGAPYYEATPQEARSLRAVPKWHSSKRPQLFSIKEQKIPVRDGAEILLRIYTPSHEEKLPIIVYYHGGGWVFGNLESVDAGCQLLAAHAKAIVVSVDYRLAPEFKFPTPINDAYDALIWVYEHAHLLNGDKMRLSVAGDSAGGNLATVMGILAKQLQGPTLTAQILIYPVTNLDFTTPSYREYGQHFGLDREAMRWFAQHYTTTENYTNPLVSPLQNQEIADSPSTLIIAAEADVLLDEGLAYAKKLAKAGVTVEHTIVPGSIHSYFSKMDYFEEATIETVKKIALFIKSVV